MKNLFFYVVLIFGCSGIKNKTRIDTVEFNYVGSVCHHFPDKQYLSSFFYVDSIYMIKYCESDTAIYISKGDSITTIKLKSRRRTIKPESILFDDIENGFYLLYRVPSNREYIYNMKGILEKFDYSGNSLYTYDFNETLFSNQRQDSIKNSRDLVFLLPYDGFGIAYSNDKLYYAYQRHTGKVGDVGFCNRLPIGGMLDLKTFESKNIDAYYPSIEEGKSMYPVNLRIFGLKHINSKIIFHFGYTNRIKIYDLNTGSIYEKSPKSYLLDSVPSQKYISGLRNVESENLKAGEFKGFVYDPFKKLYWRILNLPPKDTLDAYQLSKKLKSVAIYDTNFSLKAQFIPSRDFKYTLPFQFSSSGAMFLDSEDCINIFEYDIKPSSLKELYQQRDKRFATDFKAISKEQMGIGNYLLNCHSIKQDTMRILLLPIGSSCPSCIKDISEIFSQKNQHPFNRIICVLIGEKNNVISFVKESKINLSDPTIKVDYSDQIYRYEEITIFPIYYKVVEGVVKDKIILNPDKSSTILTKIKKEFTFE